MKFIKRAAVQAAAGVLAAAAVAVAEPAAAGAVATTTSTVGPPATSRSNAAAPAGVGVTTAINETSSTVSAALGIENPQYASERITGVSEHACALRNLRRLIYCGNQRLAPGATVRITLSLTATAAGTDHFTVYAAMTGTSVTYAYGAVTVS